MRIIWRAFSIPKLGNSPDENEDALWPSWIGKKEFTTNSFSCGLSDGATHSSFSSLWAKLLVEATGKDAQRKGRIQLRQYVERAQGNWNKKVNLYSLPWHAEEKVKQGSFATLLQFSLWGVHDSPKGLWRAVGIGDTCIFHIRREKLLAAHPVKNSMDFNNSPVILSTIDQKNQRIWANIGSYFVFGKWKKYDQFFLVTDALAHWFLQKFEDSNSPLYFLHKAKLENAKTNTPFEELVQDLRLKRQVRNDDTSLIWLTIV